MDMVQIQGLVMKYATDTPTVICNVSFKTRFKGKIGTVGRTSSCKSTLALPLFRFMKFTSGRIFDWRHRHLRSRLTIFPQDPVLWATLKRSHFIDGQQHPQQQRESSHSLDSSSLSNHTKSLTALDSPVTPSGSNWSEGQRQSIALTRPLVKKTLLIVLDEATSFVDFDTDHQIQ